MDGYPETLFLHLTSPSDFTSHGSPPCTAWAALSLEGEQADTLRPNLGHQNRRGEPQLTQHWWYQLVYIVIIFIKNLFLFFMRTSFNLFNETSLVITCSRIRVTLFLFRKICLLDIRIRDFLCFETQIRKSLLSHNVRFDAWRGFLPPILMLPYKKHQLSFSLSLDLCVQRDCEHRSLGLSLFAVKPWQTFFKLCHFFCLLFSLLTSLSHAESCRSQSIGRKGCSSQSFSNNQMFTSCMGLPDLGSSIHWNYDPSRNLLQMAYRRNGVPPSTWISWAINPTSKGMVGSQTLAAFQGSSGSMNVYPFPITSN